MDKDIIKYFRTPDQLKKWDEINQKLDSAKKERESIIRELDGYNTDAMKELCGACFRKKDGREMIMLLYPSFAKIEGECTVSVNSYKYYAIHYNECILRVPTIEGDFIDMSDILPHFEAEEDCDWEQISRNMFMDGIQKKLMSACEFFENQK